MKEKLQEVLLSAKMLDAYGFGLGVLVCLWLAGCAFVDQTMARKPLPDTRITIYQGQALRAPYSRIDDYRCYDGGPVMAEPYGAGGRTGEWELTCWRYVPSD